MAEQAPDRFDVLRKVFRTWFELTHDEQKALVLILVLFLLGLTVRFWRLESEKPGASRPPPAASPDRP